ncbi:hypothetical protein AXG93_868s1280 [Marchantia polymorpha subsp. ruderalis]|uniref:Uncharacterized protein n=1 Tax=Marchantia polymorpha subsp. ruderalis TaxID=1480154 RepID=A0A176VK74_MARPO|nr:hypothetical protein AXG93_868s1280 [Marchantia polymorpha subsp. ruderalis]
MRRLRADIAISSKNDREREELQSSQPAISETQIEYMAPKKSEKVRKLVPLKVPYEELRPFRHELRELRLEFLLWNWNCVSASICKEVLDNSATEGKELRGNSMLWIIEHWTKVMGPCTGSDEDLLFDKNSVGLTRGEEFSYGPLFETGRQGTNGWKTVDYKDPKRRAIALGIMHILRPARTTYVTAWQVGFFERILKGQRVHWARIFYDLVWVNASGRWTGSMTNHLTPFLEQPERRVAKRRKVVSDDEEELTHVVRRMDMDVSRVRQQRARARSKKRAKRRMVTVEVSDSSVEKTVAPIENTSEVATNEVMRYVKLGVPSEVSIEVLADIPAESLKEEMELVSPISQSLERTRCAQGEGTPI